MASRQGFRIASRAAKAVFVSAILACAASAAPAAPRPLTIPEVNDNIEIYKGKVITVRGFFVAGQPHYHMLWAEGPEAIKASDAIGGRDRRCLDVINYEALYKRDLRNRWVTITGKVLAAAPEDEAINLTGCAGWNSIWMDRVKAGPAPPGGRAK